MNCDFTFDELVERYHMLGVKSLKALSSQKRFYEDDYTVIPRKDRLYGWMWSSYEKITHNQETEVVEFVLFEKQVLGIEK